MEKEFISVELATKFKAKGFLDECLGFYRHDGSFKKHILELKDSADEYTIETIPAPLFQQVVEWLRTNHKIEIVVFPKFFGDGKYYYAFECLTMEYNNIASLAKLTQGAFTMYNTPNEAYNKAFEEALNLIKENVSK